MGNSQTAEMYFPQFWRLEVQVQRGQMTVLFLLADCLLCPHMLEGVFPGLFYKGTDPTHVGVFPHDLITAQSPHLLTILGIRVSTYKCSGGHKHSICNVVLFD